jgi:hypothetical protein
VLPELNFAAEHALSSLELAGQGHERSGSSVRESCLPPTGTSGAPLESWS